MGGSFYDSIREITAILSNGKSTREELQSVLRITVRALDADAGIVMLLDKQKENLLRVATYGLTEWYLRKGMVSAKNVCLSEVLAGKTVAILEAITDPQVKHPEVARQAGIASILSSPLMYKGEVMGAIRIYSRKQREFQKRDKAFLVTAASITAAELENARYRETLMSEFPGGAPDSLGLKKELTGITSEIRKPSQFGHPSEEELAKLMDFYRIEWIYEPRSFIIEKDGNRIIEMFTPDFYLPELDLYVEVTTMKQSLATEKNRKIRRLRELHPDINIKLINRKDYGRLLAKYGYGPLSEAKVRGVGSVLLSTTQIQKRVMELGREISIDYAGKRPMLVGVLKGVICFFSDVMRHISLPVSVDFLGISYFDDDKRGPVRITKDLERPITGRDVLIIEDIVDTGMTLHYLISYLQARHPASITVCTLLDKRARRLVEVPLKYVGFEIPDEFLVGYGLDFHGEYRNLPFVARLQPEVKDTSPLALQSPDATPLQV